MNTSTEEDLKNEALSVIRLIADQQYVQVERLTHGIRLRAADIEGAVKRYGRHLIGPPPDILALIDVVSVRHPYPRWSIVAPLWTQEEGRSDLSVEMTMEQKDGVLQMQLDDIRVR